MMDMEAPIYISFNYVDGGKGYGSRGASIARYMVGIFGGGRLGADGDGSDNGSCGYHGGNGDGKDSSNGDDDDLKVNLTKCEEDVLHSWELRYEEEDLVSH
jgi:hypothetical protein